MRSFAIALFVILTLTTGWVEASAAEDVVVQLTVIVASMSPGEGVASGDEPIVDSRLSVHADKLRSLFAYKRYSFAGSSRAETSFGGDCSFQLPGRLMLEVEPERFQPEGKGRIEMLVTLFQDTPSGGGNRGVRGGGDSGREIVLRTRIRLTNGGTVLLGGPPVEGGVLILALSARR